MQIFCTLLIIETSATVPFVSLPEIGKLLAAIGKPILMHAILQPVVTLGRLSSNDSSAHIW